MKFKSLDKVYSNLSGDEKKHIEERVNYYCQSQETQKLTSESKTLKEYTFRNKTGNSVYFFDTYEYLRYFSKDLKFRVAPGDVTQTFDEPTIAKTRPIGRGQNTTILSLDKVRHFLLFNDPFKWDEKKDGAIFRGSCHGKPHRQRFLEMYADDEKHSVRDCCNNSINPEKWQVKDPTPFYEHLRYKYIIALEGNDVASNLKWVMSSNSIAVTPRMHYESWFMEGRLIPNYHYIEIADDYHDLNEKLQYYTEHPDEAKEIIRHAHEWINQFRNKNIEDIVAVRTLQKYFVKTGQKP